MFAFNFLFWLLGCAILGVGIWIRVDPNLNQYVESSDNFNYLYTGAYMLIAVGVVSMVIGFLGCCGAIRESQCMLATFFIFLFIIFIVLLGAGVWAIVGQDELQKSVTETLNKAVKDYYDEKKPYAKNLMDNVQTNFECCGSALASGDYLFYITAIPKTCTNIATPCNKKLFEYFADNLIIIAGVGIGIGVVMLLGMVFSMLLCCAIREVVA